MLRTAVRQTAKRGTGAIAIADEVPDPDPKIINSQLSSTNKSQFYVLVAVSQGTIDTVELFPDETTAKAALNRLQDDYHSEANDL